jgi:uncharacterized protein YjiS (DUF1127 family)
MPLLQHIAELFAAWRCHRRQRQEFIDFLASDHRAAADIGITAYEAQQYIDRPFWRETERATFPGRGAARERCTADPGSFQAPRL